MIHIDTVENLLFRRINCYYEPAHMHCYFIKCTAVLIPGFSSSHMVVCTYGSYDHKLYSDLSILTHQDRKRFFLNLHHRACGCFALSHWCKKNVLTHREKTGRLKHWVWIDNWNKNIEEIVVNARFVLVRVFLSIFREQVCTIYIYYQIKWMLF